jgi:HSP20 family protein
MAIIKWDPLDKDDAFQDRIDKLFDDSFPGCRRKDGSPSPCAWTPGADIYETAQHVIIALDLPGVNKHDVTLEMKDNILTISGQRQTDSQRPAAHYYRRERSCGPFCRAFSLHAPVDPEQVKARFNNGVLMVEIAKPEKDAPRRVRVDVE